jgi:hypothetical protein
MPHDPDASMSPVDLEEEPAADVVRLLQENSDSSAFYLYPNLNSFKLRDWFWSDRNQKSQESWKELTSIVGNPSYQPEDIKDTNWEKINHILGSSEFEGKNLSDSLWYEDGMFWNTTPVTIRVSFNGRSAAQEPKNYTLEDF